MGSSYSTPSQPILCQTFSIQCDGSGRGEFTCLNSTGQPGVPGVYQLVFSINVNYVRIHGIMVNNIITQDIFAMQMYDSHPLTLIKT